MSEVTDNMAEEKKNTEQKQPELFKVKTARAQQLSDDEVENAAGGKCWFYHTYRSIEDSFHPEGHFRKGVCKDCGEVIYQKDGEEISKEEYDRVRNDGQSLWAVWS